MRGGNRSAGSRDLGFRADIGAELDIRQDDDCLCASVFALPVFLQAHLKGVIREFRQTDIKTSLFLDPVPDQIKMAAKLEADAVELNTGTYADLPQGADPSYELSRLRDAARWAAKLGLRVLAGHGLNLRNVGAVADIPEIEELNIGHSIVARAVLVGFERAVQEMLQAIARKP